MQSFVRSRLERARSDEGGFTLIELLVTIAIMSIALTTLIAGLGAAITASDSHRKHANGQTVLRQDVETLKAATYSSCSSSTVTPTGPAPYSTVPLTASATGFGIGKITKVEMLNLDTNVVPDTWYTLWDASHGYYLGTCGTLHDDSQVQKITISISSIDGRATESTVFVKRGIA